VLVSEAVNYPILTWAAIVACCTASSILAVPFVLD
jgi:hypothetical protein